MLHPAWCHLGTSPEQSYQTAQFACPGLPVIPAHPHSLFPVPHSSQHVTLLALLPHAAEQAQGEHAQKAALDIIERLGEDSRTPIFVKKGVGGCWPLPSACSLSCCDLTAVMQPCTCDASLALAMPAA